MMRVVIFKKDLLIPLWIYPVNFVLLGVGLIAGGALILWKRRVMVVSVTHTHKGAADACTDTGDVSHIHVFAGISG